MLHIDRRSLSLLGFAAITLPPFARSQSIGPTGRQSIRLPLESPTSQEQRWIATALVSSNQIWQNHEAGAPGNNAWCIFEAGDTYVQFLAPWNAQLLVCEAVSATSVPELAGILGPQAIDTLLRLGFTPPDVSPNYSQTIIVESSQDLADAARLAFYVLREVYRVADFAHISFKVKLPTSSPRLAGLRTNHRTALRKSTV